jgi:hypothetical protein
MLSEAAVKDKRRILREFTAATGYHEKSAIRVLNSSPSPSAAGPVNGRRSMMRPFGVPGLCCGRTLIRCAASA